MNSFAGSDKRGNQEREKGRTTTTTTGVMDGGVREGGRRWWRQSERGERTETDGRQETLRNKIRHKKNIFLFVDASS